MHRGRAGTRGQEVAFNPVTGKWQPEAFSPSGGACWPSQPQPVESLVQGSGDSNQQVTGRRQMGPLRGQAQEADSILTPRSAYHKVLGALPCLAALASALSSVGTS